MRLCRLVKGRSTTMGNKNTVENGTADQYRRELKNEIEMAVYDHDVDTCCGLEFDDYLILLTNELTRITK